MEKNSLFHPQVRLRIAGEIPFMGPGPYELLLQVAQLHSLQKACQEMDLSYSKGRRLIADLEQELGEPVLERRIGGDGGGGSALTEIGAEIVLQYGKMADAMQQTAEQLYEGYVGELEERLKNR